MPPIKCYPGQLNQVFLNILSDAIDALEERVVNDDPIRYVPTIKIQADVVDLDWLMIYVSDNRTAIPMDVQQTICAPFLMTKTVGKGTGLGLSISHQIITINHYGSLEYVSHVERGTDFIIAIPFKMLLAQKYPKDTLKLKF